MKKTIVLLMLMTVISSVTLTACGSTPAETTPVTQPPAAQEVQTTPVVSEQAVSEPTVTVSYADGTYDAPGTYTAPSGEESIKVSVTVKENKVTDVNITTEAKDPTTKMFIDKFIAGVDGVVVGKRLDEISGLSAVNGSSLTPKGFEVALASIKTQAKFY